MSGHRLPDARNPFHALFGKNLGVGWHRNFGVDQAAQAGEVTKWLDYVRLTSLASIAVGQRPAFAADGVVWGGQKVVKCSTSGVRGLCTTGTAIPIAVFPTGSRPYLLADIRVRTAALANLVGLCQDTTAAELFPYLIDGSTLRLLAQQADRVTGVAYTTARMTLECWTDGTKANVRLNGSLTQANYAGALAGPGRQVALAVSPNLVSGPADLSVGSLHICKAYPGDAVCAAARGMISANV